MQRCKRSHHDRPEAHEARFADRVGRVRPLAALRLEREVDHHDRVLLDDADQHDDSDECIQVELAAEQQQCEQRAEARGWQARQDRERMHVAFVQNSEHDIDHEHGEREQPAESGR
jgi:hypothetical protein